MKTAAFLLAFLETWSWAYRGPGGGIPAGIALETRNGYLVPVNLWSQDTQQDVWLLEIGRDGAVLGAKRYGGEGDESSFSACGVAGGGLVLGANRMLGALEGRDVWLLRLDEHGAVVWQKRYGKPGELALARLRCLGDGGMLALGSAGIDTATPGLWVARLSADGIIVWQKILRSEWRTEAIDSAPLRDGGIALLASVQTSDEGLDAWVVRFRGDGSITWQATYGGAGDEHPSVVFESADGRIVVAGSTWSPPQPPRPIDGGAFVLRLSENGRIDWQKGFRAPGLTTVTSVDESAGGLVLAGTTHFRDVFSIWSLDHTGRIGWQRTFDRSLSLFAPTLRPTLDGGFIATTSPEALGSPPAALWMLKLDGQGRVADLGVPGSIVAQDTFLRPRGTAVIPRSSTIGSADTHVAVRDETGSIARIAWPVQRPDGAGAVAAPIRVGQVPGVGRVPPSAAATTIAQPSMTAERIAAAPRDPRRVLRREAGRAPFNQTIVAADRDHLVWPTRADVYVVTGVIADLPSYGSLRTEFLSGASTLDIAADDPAPSSGFYYLVRSPARGSWQSSVGAEPGRDALLP